LINNSDHHFFWSAITLQTKNHHAATFSLDDESHDAIRALARNERVGISFYLRRLIKNANDTYRYEKKERRAVDRLVDELTARELA
jgi:hypothetical protein